jgi:amidohydrolase
MNDRLQRAVRERAQSLTDFVVATRRDIHAHPELGNQERRTPALVVDIVRELGCEVQDHVGGTGVVAVLRGAHPGPTLALRADMDALPLNEEADRPYRSCVPGVMHACGHDGHTAMLLGAARVLAALRDELHGNVKLLFQPAEETYGGAGSMIADGCLTTAPAVDAIFGLHVWPDGDVGELRVRSGPVMASADALRIVVHGKGGHASEPHDAIDPVPIAAHIITQLQTLVTRRFDAKSPVVITITYLQAGTALNVLPPDAIIAGTVRCVDPAARAALPGRIEALAQHTAAAFGATAEVMYLQGSGVVVNDADFTDFVRGAIRNARGAEAVKEVPYAIMGAEDFGAYLERVPGSMAFLGARPAHQEAFPCHHPQFDLNEDALPIGVEILATVALDYLRGTRD